MKNERSHRLYDEGLKYLPGGVDSPVRAFGAVGGQPLFIARGKGSHIWDADGNEYIDYVGSWGPLILGHAHPKVVATVRKAAGLGTSFGAPTELEVELAKLVCSALPSVEMVRFVSSGTEATMSALRLARAFTKRDKVLKFAGCYHGHADGLLVRAGSGVATFALPDSPGVPSGYAQNTLVAPYNDLLAAEALFQKQGEAIAAIIVEPVAANMGVVPPLAGFLEGLRGLTRRYGSLLIFDEVITGFRVSWGGAQGIYDIQPDLTCLGKVVGGGLPVGAYGGRRDIMSLVAPLGPVYQAGTLSGNPLAMAAGLATLKELTRPGIYVELEALGARLQAGLEALARRIEVPTRVNRVGSLLTLFFAGDEVTDYDSARRSDTERFARFFRAMLEQGIYLPPSQFEAIFLSLAHSEEDLERTLQATEQSLSTTA
ncbi:MAG: glutamate-1-semialdehyde 2,1-aminomutase [Chloroflexi bacterium]|nr:glutamate-1-semialdehyde 2,1-aminomutase [Chloroflexota bacterium]